jgi:hypothetical protein
MQFGDHFREVRIEQDHQLPQANARKGGSSKENIEINLERRRVSVFQRPPLWAYSISGGAE